MRRLAGAALLGTALAGSPPPEPIQPKLACGICRELTRGLPCEWFGACDTPIVAQAADGCEAICPTTVAGPPAPLAPPGLELRVAKAFGTRPYGQLRISAVTTSAEPPVAGFFDYSAQFMHRWTQFYLHTALKTVSPGDATELDLGGGAKVSVRLPKQGAGIAGVLVADPCVNSATGKYWVPCEYGAKFQTLTRTPELINAFAEDDDTDFWSISGDNFYDRTGEISADVFGRISLQAKSKIFASVPGNHDYWAFGSPMLGISKDQCGNGFMQFYGQDVKAAENLTLGSADAPYSFAVHPSANVSVLPDLGIGWGCTVSEMKNFVWYNQIGNVGLIGQSAAYTLEEAMPFMREACAWLPTQEGLEVVLLMGHWDIEGSGSKAGMDMPVWYAEMAALPGCAEFEKRGMLKFVMGHTHCNDPHPHGKVGAGFRVAGFGMEGCGNYGMPLVDTTGGRVRFWYFDTSSDELYDQVLGCVRGKGWRRCTSHAALWLDQPIAPAQTRPAGELEVVV